MKKSFLSVLLILGIFTLSKAQVTGINYLIEYNESTSYYDCKIVIASGGATTVPQRIQFNAQYSIVVPTGAECSVVENHNPLESNQNYMGTIPCNWEIGLSVISPYNKPIDYYSVTPNLGTTVSYNNLSTGDTVTIFSLYVDVDPCDNAVRPFDNVVDEYDGPVWPVDFSNGFTLGSITQIYSGNLKSSYGIINLYEPIEMCPGTIGNIPTDLNGTWESDNPEIASVDEFTGKITALSSGITNITFIEDNSGCASILETTILDIAEVNFIGDNQICIGETSSVSPFNSGTWFSTDPTIATVDNSGNIVGHSEGLVTLIHTNNENGCISNPLTLTVLPPSDLSCLVNVKDEISETINVFPNPTKGTVYIEAESPIQSITIYTSDYKKVEEVSFYNSKNECQLPLTNLNPGFYFLRIQSNDKYVFTKLILE